MEQRGAAKLVGRSGAAQDAEVARRLSDVSEELTGVHSSPWSKLRRRPGNTSRRRLAGGGRRLLPETARSRWRGPTLRSGHARFLLRRIARRAAAKADRQRAPTARRFTVPSRSAPGRGRAPPASSTRSRVPSGRYVSRSSRPTCERFMNHRSPPGRIAVGHAFRSRTSRRHADQQKAPIARASSQSSHASRAPSREQPVRRHVVGGSSRVGTFLRWQSQVGPCPELSTIPTHLTPAASTGASPRASVVGVDCCFESPFHRRCSAESSMGTLLSCSSTRRVAGIDHYTTSIVT